MRVTMIVVDDDIALPGAPTKGLAGALPNKIAGALAESGADLTLLSDPSRQSKDTYGMSLDTCMFGV